MAQKQNEKEALLCTHGNCKELQTGDGEFCDKHYGNYVDQADVCELVHELAKMECKTKKIDIEKVNLRKYPSGYTEITQPIFDKYYELITNILNV